MLNNANNEPRDLDLKHQKNIKIRDIASRRKYKFLRLINIYPPLDDDLRVEQFLKKNKQLFEDFKADTKLQIFFSLFDVARFVALAFVLTIFAKGPTALGFVQCLLFLAINIVFLVYFVK